VKRRHPVLLASALAVAAASPAAAADFTIAPDESNPNVPLWTPATLTIAPGDTVTWKLASAVSPPLPHDVKSTVVAGTDPWTLEAGPPPAADGTMTFTTSGRFQYYCRFHSDGTTGMAGTIVVGNPPPPPPPPPGQQPFPNDTPEPTTFENKVAFDTTRPTLRSVRVRGTAKGAKVSFRVSERADVTVRLKRGRKVVKTRHVTVSGRGRVTIGRKALRAGRYRVELRARDIAGNASSRRAARITLR
jgi:plastocyanin